MPTHSSFHEPFHDVPDDASPEPSLELETARAHDLVGPYGAFVATMAPADPAVDPSAPRSFVPVRSNLEAGTAPASLVERGLEALAVLPLSIWKRIALYSFLAIVFGNLLRCGGLSASSNLIFAFLVVLGLAGVVASVQRNP